MQKEQETARPLAQGTAVPQFATAEYAHIPGTERCRICSRSIFGDYYRVNDQMACPKCAGEAREGQPSDSHGAFARGLLLAVGAAVLGLTLYATFTIVTNFYLGYIALGVGWLVAKAMLKGSNGVGGLRYQIAAVVLTYAAISIAAVPIGVAGAVKHYRERVVQQRQSVTANEPSTGDNASTQTQNSPSVQKRLGGFAFRLLVRGVASPFLQLQNPVSGLIRLLILLVGLRIAFQLTAARPLDVDGPYPAAAS